MKAALYIHIPFCAKKCAYCDFESYAGRLNEADEYIARLLDEARIRQDEYQIQSVPSVYIGGGTPSLLSMAQTEALISGISRLFPLSENVEFSMEANPGTVSREKLLLLKQLGVNRLSFGAQASQTHLLKLLGRIHEWKDVEAAVDMAHAAGIGNVNIDLMYALPEQTEEDFRQSIRSALALAPSHLSMYSLILEEGCELTRQCEEGKVQAPDDEASVNMQRAAMEECLPKDMQRYEISNYSFPGAQCRHNIAYWTRENYLGLGCAAHSLMREERFSNPGFDEYMKGKRKTEFSMMSRTDRLEETVMLETRMTRGIDLHAFSKNFGTDARDALIRRAGFLEQKELVHISNGYLSLTTRGMDVQNAVIVHLLEAF